jgi:hypothetical protein
MCYTIVATCTDCLKLILSVSVRVLLTCIFVDDLLTFIHLSLTVHIIFA